MRTRRVVVAVALTLAMLQGPALAGLLDYNSATPAGNSAKRAEWLAGAGITTPQHLVDFESGFVAGQNVHGVVGLFPGGLVIKDNNPTDCCEAFIRSDPADLGGSFPVGVYALAHDEKPYLELDFSSSPVDYVAFQDIDHNGVSVRVTLVGGATVNLAFEGTEASGNSAEFYGIFRNDLPKITKVELDPEAGDGEWGIDTIEYGTVCTEFSRGGTDDAFALPSEPASRSANLTAALTLPALDYDAIPGVGGVASNQQLAQTFANLPAGMTAAVLMLDLRAGSAGLGPGTVTDDRIRLGFADASGFSEQWSGYFGDGNPEPALVGGFWTTDRQEIMGLDLSRLPVAGGGTLNLIPLMQTRGFLDVIVEDNTGADHLRLSFSACPNSLLDAGQGRERGSSIRLAVGPNPVRSVARFHIATPRSGSARLSVYDATGRRVAVPFDGTVDGSANPTWDLVDTRGRPVAAGMYFARLDFEGAHARVGMIVVR